MSVNMAILVGRVGESPKVRNTPGGQLICNFSVATNRTFKKHNGEKERDTQWHRIVAWGKLGELCQTYLRKGREVFVEGRIHNRKWSDKEGRDHFSSEVVASTIRFIGSPRDRASVDTVPEREDVDVGWKSPNGSVLSEL